MRSLMLIILMLYRKVLSPIAWGLGARCRFHPTCSEYATEAIARHGAIRASALILKRLLRCGPWSAGGIDHVPVR